ncbi:MAG: S1C family serine protease [Alphaproteobacteria bacterium]
MINSAALKFLFCIFLICGVSACADVRKAHYNAPLEEPEDSHSAPIKFTKMKVELPLGEDIGLIRKNCFLFYLNLNGKILHGMPKTLMDDSFTLSLEPLGYDVVNQLNKDFDEEVIDELLRSEYKISAKIIDADINACNDTSHGIFELGNPRYKGELFLKIEWAVYDNLRKKTVYKTVTQGYTNQKRSNADGIELMITDAFSMAAHNFGADKNFHDLIFFGKTPPDNWRKSKKKKPTQSRPRAFDTMESVVIHNPQISQTALSNHIDTTRKIAVLVQAGEGHGSGFFITNQGHIITNSHVVGDAMRVRIVTADKEEKLIAEVLRTDKVHDIALLKLEKTPEGLNIITAPLQTIWPKVSADIYALGAPTRTSLQDTLTKGIVSAHRKNYKIWGTTVDLIQGDVAIHGGNSGGALLDAYGNIIGMAVAGFGELETLNLFIPIEDALKALDITLSP